jgi:hypothetical protein
MYAVMMRNEDCVRVLLKYKPDQSLRNRSGMTAYELASKDFKILLDPDHTSKPTVNKAIGSDDARALRDLLTREPEKMNLPIDSVCWPRLATSPSDHPLPAIRLGRLL